MSRKMNESRTMDKSTEKILAHSFQLKRYKWALIIIWTLLIVSSLLWNLSEQKSATLEKALVHARQAFDKDILFRRWNASHGGVYVRVTKETQPNPYLPSTVERDIKTPSGKQLTLMNPAYMTRQVHELGKKQYGIFGHITSLRPIRPENIPDQWETKALRSFEQGETEVSSLYIIEGKEYMRYMHSLITEKSCLQCHAAQGYKEGDIRGGISVSVPMKPLWAITQRSVIKLSLAHVILWLIGLAGIAFSMVYLKRSERERKQAEVMLTRFGSILEDSLNEIYIFDPESLKFIQVNRGARENLGYSMEEMKKFTPLDLKMDFTLEAFKKMIKPLIKGEKKILTFYTTHKRKNGSFYHVEVHLQLNIIEDMKVFVAIILDITKRKKLEEEQQKTHKLASIGILAGGIAHDFNNLLSGILNNLYLIKVYLDSDRKENTYERLEAAEKAISKATNLTRQLLTFAKGGTPIRKTASIIEIIKESAEFVLKGSNVKCEYIMADDVWPVEVDEGQMNQVIHNLILNANQSMPEGGTIRISTKNFVLSSDTGLPLQEGRYVKVAVQDQGTGISEEYLKSIFDPYFTTKETGRGLGLSITYSIIKQHDGLLTAESELGVGTTFTIYLPASEKQVEEKESVECTPVAGEGKILIMDDEEIIRESLGEYLTMKGYEVEYAEDGEKAIELHKKALEASQPFDAVILDLTIRGGMGGKTAIKKLHEIDPKVKAIVSSGYSNDPAMANFMEYGFSDVFNKASNSPDDLCRILNKAIKKP